MTLHPTILHAPAGRTYDICNPGAQPIDLADVADRLARTIRFNGVPGALSVAQHEVLGAEAILAEGGSPHLAALYLHHDDHKFVLGDQARPVANALAMLAPDFQLAWEQLRANWDKAIYTALGLPPPGSWWPRDAEAIAMMNARMTACEARVLFGPRAISSLPAAMRRTPRFESDLRPWPPERAAEQWKLMHRKLTGRSIR